MRLKASGSTFSGTFWLSKARLSRCCLYRGPVTIRNSNTIAHILGALDDKIELNRQMSKTLDDNGTSIV